MTRWVISRALLHVSLGPWLPDLSFLHLTVRKAVAFSPGPCFLCLGCEN